MMLSHFIFILIVFDIYLLDFYFSVYLLYVAYVNYIIKRIWYGMVCVDYLSAVHYASRQILLLIK